MRQLLFVCVLIALLVGCSPNNAPSAPKLDPNSAEGRGSALFSGKGRCATCHSISPDVTIVGPSLAGIATRAETREPPLTAAEYLEESILDPDKFKPPGFEMLQMDTSLAKSLTTDEITDLVAYMLTLK
jgi:cytochrome c551/c552